MCLGIPMKIKKIDGDSAIVGSSGVERKISISFLPHVKIGDYVIVHAGFAIEKLNPKKAKETLKILREIR